jgi:tetratricopeptide (TPR) repeat protein
MDRRFSLIVGLGLGVLGGSGCTPSSLFSSSSSTPQTTQSRKEPELSPITAAKERVKEKEFPKRTPKAATCVAFGHFRLEQSMAPGRSPQEVRQYRDQAKKAYQQAIDQDPKCLDAYRGIAQIHAADGEQERAVSVFKSALKLNPNDAPMWFELGMHYSRLKEWNQAVEALTRAATIDPENRQYANMVGFCLARAGQYQESLVYFTRVVGEAKARYNIARMMLHMGQTDQGKMQLELALQLEPNLSEAKGLMAQLANGASGKEIVPVQYQPE